MNAISPPVMVSRVRHSGCLLLNDRDKLNSMEPVELPESVGKKGAHLARMTIDPLAESILKELARQPGSEQIVLGGYFALRHHIDYRTTHDIDAWWKSRSDVHAEAAIRTAMKSVADAKGLQLTERRFGETVSFELSQGKMRVFSFQVAVRSVELEPPQASAWPPILIETLTDNVASKMNALVDRGAPRDFTDIFQVVSAGLMRSSACWDLWVRKNVGQAPELGKQKVMVHLAGLEQRRPLSSITEDAEKERAASLRRWFREEFIRP